MRKLAIAMALASTAIASPAVARDHSFYAGLEGGGMIVEDTHLRYRDVSNNLPDAYIVNYNTGFDVDAIAGYDLGWLRLEGELGYKHASVAGVTSVASLSPVISGDLDGGRLNVLSGMFKALLDFGNEDALSGYMVGGLGLAGGDADVPGWFGDPGNGELPGASAASAAATAGARARPVRVSNTKERPARATRPGRFSFVRRIDRVRAGRPARAA